MVVFKPIDILEFMIKSKKKGFSHFRSFNGSFLRNLVGGAKAFSFLKKGLFEKKIRKPWFRAGFPKLLFQISSLRDLKNEIAPLTHLRSFFALYLQLKNN